MSISSQPISTTQQVTAPSSPSQHLTMKEATVSGNHSYYPSARRMMTSNNMEAVRQKRPRMELTLTHDQWMDTPVVMNTGQQPQQQPPQQPQQQQLPSVRCTVCKDSDGTPVFYRPSMALHTLFQAPDQDDPSPAAATTAARHSQRQTVNENGTMLYKVDSKQQNSNKRMSMLSMYDIKSGGSGMDNNNNSISSSKHTSRIGNDDNNDGNADDGDDNGSNDNDDDVDDDDDDGLYQRLVIPKQRQCYVTLYDATNDQPIWSLLEQDWHTMTLISRQPPQKYTMLTTSTFSFVWEDQAITSSAASSNFLFPYQWQMKLAKDGTTMELLCEQYQPDHRMKKRPVALLANQATQLILFGNDDDDSNETPTSALPLENDHDDGTNNKNPFRSLQDSKHQQQQQQQQQRKLDSLDTFLVLSSLLLYDLITSQLRALGGETEAMVMMIDRQQQALEEEIDMFYKQYQQQQRQKPMTNNNNNNMVHHTNPSHYYSGHDPMDDDDMDREIVMDHHSNNSNNNGGGGGQLRWSSTGSMKSLELDPGFWRCCFGYGCWWSWFPCCMPGGWCDRAWIKVRGVRRQQHHNHHHHRSRVTRRMQGWQQQEE